MRPKGLPSYCYWGTPPRDPDACPTCGDTDCNPCAWCGAHDVPLSLYKQDEVCERCVREDVEDQRAQEAKQHGAD